MARADRKWFNVAPAAMPATGPTPGMGINAVPSVAPIIPVAPSVPVNPEPEELVNPGKIVNPAPKTGLLPKSVTVKPGKARLF